MFTQNKPQNKGGNVIDTLPDLKLSSQEKEPVKITPGQNNFMNNPSTGNSGQGNTSAPSFPSFTNKPNQQPVIPTPTNKPVQPTQNPQQGQKPSGNPAQTMNFSFNPQQQQTQPNQPQSPQVSSPINAMFSQQPQAPKQDPGHILHVPGNESHIVGNLNEHKDLPSEPKSALDLEFIYYKLKKQEVLNAKEKKFLAQNYSFVYRVMNENNYSFQTEKHTLKIEELESLKKPQKQMIQLFWHSIAESFSSRNINLHEVAIIELVKQHIKQNHTVYYQGGHFNVHFFMYEKAFHMENNQASGVNIRSPLHRKILMELDKELDIFNNQMQKVLSMCDKKLLRELKANVVHNVWESFKTIYNVDLNNPYDMKGRSLAIALIKLYVKAPELFSKDLVCDMLKFLDSHFRIIPKVCVEQLTELLCFLLFQSPYKIDEWNAGVSNIIMSLRSFHLSPFKWCLQLVKPSVQPMIGELHRVQGKKWIPMANLFILRASEKKYDPTYQKFLFILVCSIISADPVSFWNDGEKYSTIYKYIENLEYSSIESYEAEESVGKIMRIMICSMNSSDEYTKNQLAHKVYNFFPNYFLKGVKTQDFFGNEVLTKFNQQGNSRSMQDLEQKYHYSSIFCAYELILKLGINNTRLVVKIAKDFGAQLESFVEHLTFFYLDDIYESNHQHIETMFQFFSSLYADEELRVTLFNILDRYLKGKKKALERMFETLLKTPSNVKVVTDHMRALINIDQEKSSWFKMLLDELQKSINFWKVPTFQHYADLISEGFGKIKDSKKIPFPVLPDVLLTFINWGLTMVQSTLERGRFESLLLLENQFEPLKSTLKIIEVLIICELQGVVLPERIKRFWSLSRSQIELPENKTTSLFTALACVVLFTPPNVSRSDQSSIITSTLNVLSLLYSLNQSKKEGQISYQIFESYHINDYNKVYFSIQHLLKQYILDTLNAPIEDEVGGKVMDFIVHGRIFTGEQVMKIVKKRVVELESQDSRTYEVLALSRYMLYLIIEDHEFITKAENRRYMISILDLIVETIRLGVKEPKVEMQHMRVNMWKCLMGCQAINCDLYVELVKRYYPFILQTAYLNRAASSPETLIEHKKMLEIFLSCRTYLTLEQYSAILQISSLGQALLRLIYKLIDYSNQFTNSLYCLEIYLDTQPKNHKQQLTRIKNIMIEKVSQLKPKNNLSLIGFLMFLSLHLKEEFTIPENYIFTTFSPLLMNYQTPGQICIGDALEVIADSSHPINFISAMHFLYRAVNEGFHDEFYAVLKVLELILRDYNKDYHRLWSYTILNAIVCNCADKSLIVNVCGIVFQGKFASNLGALLGAFVGAPVRWSYGTSAWKEIDLVDKHILLSMLKLIGSLLLVKDIWEDIYPHQYEALCLSFGNCVEVLQAVHKMKDTTKYLQALKEIKPKTLVKKVIDPSTYAQESENLGNAYAEVTNCLEVLDEHINLLIYERFLFVLVPVYQNPKHTFTQYQPLMSLLNLTIYKLKQQNDNPTYTKNLLDAATIIYESHSISQSLFFVNLVEEQPADQKTILNCILECGLECAQRLKMMLEITKEGIGFRNKLYEVISAARKSEAINFDIAKYSEGLGGNQLQSRSYRTTSRKR